jgi:type II restriction enzyme
LIEDDNLKINNNIMKFDAIVGNPPYQTRKEGTSDSPIYHQFMDLTYELCDKSILITPGRFLFNAGKTPKAWNEKMLSDKNLKVVYYNSNSSDVFPDIVIMGGIAITLRDAKKEFGAIKTFTHIQEVNSILKKVEKIKSDSISEMVYAPESYKLSKKLHTDFPDVESKLSKGHKYDLTTNIFEKLSELFTTEKPESKEKYIQILGRENNSRVLKWIKKEYVEEHDNLNYYKVIIPKSNGSKPIGDLVATALIGEPQICGPNKGHNQTFISIGQFETKVEAENLLKYIKGKFSRLLLGVLKVTQDNKQKVWNHVPIQNFTNDSDIDWSKSIAEIDKQLYKKYKLSIEEIEFIEKMIKPM